MYVKLGFVKFGSLCIKINVDNHWISIRLNSTSARCNLKLANLKLIRVSLTFSWRLFSFRFLFRCLFSLWICVCFSKCFFSSLMNKLSLFVFYYLSCIIVLEITYWVVEVKYSFILNYNCHSSIFSILHWTKINVL